MVAGAYTVRAVYPGYLAAQKALVISGSVTTNLGTVSLRGGDVNGDNAINMLDIGVILSKFGRGGFTTRSSVANCLGTDEPADINDDTNVNISDLAIVAGNWGAVGPTLWP
jgi:uncharacterized membrane protein